MLLIVRSTKIGFFIDMRETFCINCLTDESSAVFQPVLQVIHETVCSTEIEIGPYASGNKDYRKEVTKKSFFCI